MLKGVQGADVKPGHRGMATALGIGVSLLIGTASAQASELGSSGLSPLVTTPGTFSALLLMQGSLAGLGDLVLPVFSIVLALGALRLWRERAPRGIRFWPGGLPWRMRSRSCVRPSPTAYSTDFDRGQILRDAKRRFVELQAAWDARDLDRLRNWTTPEMLDELLGELSALPVEGRQDPTQVTALHAELLGFERIAGFCLTSIEFSGMLRESVDREPVSFREVWMMTHPVDAATEWRLARQQTLF